MANDEHSQKHMIKRQTQSLSDKDIPEEPHYEYEFEPNSPKIEYDKCVIAIYSERSQKTSSCHAIVLIGTKELPAPPQIPFVNEPCPKHKM